MDTMLAFQIGEQNRGKKLMVFDWDKAAKLIKENKALSASAGLQADWEWTGGDIFIDGVPVLKENSYTYLASTWAIPELEIKTEDGDDVFECYKMQDDVPEEWGTNYAKIFWPESALEILKGN
jgi:hypothetical protein